MPLYDYRCPECGHRAQAFRRVDDRHQAPPHEHSMVLAVTAPTVRGDISGYHSPITGQWIGSSRAAREDMKRHGCREWDPGEKQDAIRRREQNDRDLDASIERTVGTFIEDLPQRKRERLEVELANGFTAVPVRTEPGAAA